MQEQSQSQEPPQKQPQKQNMFEGSGATILFNDNPTKMLVFALRNPQYVKNEKKESSFEYPGGKVDESDYSNTKTPEEAAIFAAVREWDEEVFSALLSDESDHVKWRGMLNQYLRQYLEKSTYEDVKGAKALIRMFMPEIDLSENHSVENNGQMMLDLLRLVDSKFQKQFENDSSQVPLVGVISIPVENMVTAIKNISTKISELEKVTPAKDLMKTIRPFVEAEKIVGHRLHSGTPVEQHLRVFNFFTLRAILQKTEYLK